MSSVSEAKIRGPNSHEEPCAMFVIDMDKSFILSNLKIIKDNVHTLSFWIKSEAVGRVTVHDKILNTDTEWKRFVVTFTPDTDKIQLKFEPGTYYLWHAQLEAGNIVTDWSPDPDDIYEAVSKLKKLLNL